MGKAGAWVGLMSVLMAAATAWAAPPPPRPQPNPEPLRGFVSEETLPGVLTFRRCNAEKLVARAYLLDDLTAERSLLAGVMAVRETQMDRERPMYVEFHGVLTDKLVQVKRFERAVGFIENCGAAALAAPQDATLYAEGMIPVSWRFIANASGARLVVAGAKPVRIQPKDLSAPKREGEVSIYDAWSRLDGGSLRVEVVHQACVDAGAETAYGAQARVRWGSRTFEGCAARY